MIAAQSILSQLAEEFRESLLAFQAQAAAEPEVDLALFPDLDPEPTGSNAWLAYMEYGSDERGHWPPAALVAADGSVRLEYGEATLEVLPPVRRAAFPKAAAAGVDLATADRENLPY